MQHYYGGQDLNTTAKGLSFSVQQGKRPRLLSPSPEYQIAPALNDDDDPRRPTKRPRTPIPRDDQNNRTQVSDLSPPGVRPNAWRSRSSTPPSQCTGPELRIDKAITASQTTANFKNLSLAQTLTETQVHKGLHVDHQTVCIGRVPMSEYPQIIKILVCAVPDSCRSFPPGQSSPNH